MSQDSFFKQGESSKCPESDFYLEGAKVWKEGKKVLEDRNFCAHREVVNFVVTILNRLADVRKNDVSCPCVLRVPRRGGGNRRSVDSK